MNTPWENCISQPLVGICRQKSCLFWLYVYEKWCVNFTSLPLWESCLNTVYTRDLPKLPPNLILLVSEWSLWFVWAASRNVYQQELPPGYALIGNVTNFCPSGRSYHTNYPTRAVLWSNCYFICCLARNTKLNSKLFGLPMSSWTSL